MKLKRIIIGIVLAFSATGVVAENNNAEAYQELYIQQDKQEQHIETLLRSEFISKEDSTLLQQKMTDMNEAEKKDNRRTLENLLAEEEKEIVNVNKRIVDNEEAAIKREQKQLSTELDTLEKKSQEAYIDTEDQQQLTVLENEAEKVVSTTDIVMIRSLSAKVNELSIQMTKNQTVIIEAVTKLKELNKASEALGKQKYLLSSDKEELKKDREENASFFEKADSLQKVTSRQDDSETLLAHIKTKQQASGKDFEMYEKKAKDLLQTTNALFSEGDLIADEKEQLNQASQALNDSLDLKEYQPGDLEKEVQLLQRDYDEFLGNSNKRKEEAKEKAKKEAAEQAAREKEAAEKAQIEAEKQAAREQEAAQVANQQGVEQPANATPSSTLVGEWHQAPAGYKYLKVDSGKTYGQVKNPGNFSLITDDEAANYTPGHGNGSAKQ